MKKLIFFILLILPTIVLALPTAKVTLLVKNESGEPVSQANAGVGFRIPKSEGWGSKSKGDKGLTDDEGLFTGEGETEQIILYGAKKSGYYSYHDKFTDLTGVSGITGFRRWQPWNPTLEVVLKKIKNPIAMYVYDTDRVKLPKFGEFIGYDLIKQDWLIPYGKGITADFLLKITKDVREKFDYTIDFELNFLSELDGIQSFDTKANGGSELKSDHLAPSEGYNNNFKNRRERTSGKVLISPFIEGRNYYFRTRCDDDLESCLYGKVYGDIDFSSKSVRFIYYLNPTPGDRNVEFDPKKNLFKQRRGYEIKAP